MSHAPGTVALPVAEFSMATLLERLFGPSDPDQANRALEQCLQRVAADDTPVNRAPLFQRLLSAEFLVPVAAIPDGYSSGALVPLADMPALRLITVRNESGESALLAFTSKAALTTWNPAGPEFVRLAASELITLAHGNDFAAVLLNFGSPAGYEINREELEILRNGGLPLSHRQEGGGGRLVSAESVSVEAADVGTGAALASALQAACEPHIEVSAAHVFMLQAGNSEANLTIGLRLNGSPDDARRSVIFSDLAGLMRPLASTAFVDVVALDSPDFCTLVERVAPAVYVRGSAVTPTPAQ